MKQGVDIMNNKKVVKAIKWLLIALFFQAGLLLLASYHVYKKIIHKKSDKSEILKNTTTDKSIDLKITNRDFFNDVLTRDVYVKSRDDLMLHGYYVENNSKQTIILIHGYDSNGYRKGPMAKVFYDHGYNVLSPDLRAHGQSQGSVISMGWPDHYDLLEWIDLVNAIKPDGQIVLLGVSMGAATILNATGLSLPRNVKAAIADCAFTSPWELYQYQFKNQYHAPTRPILDFVNLFNSIENKSDFKRGPIDMVAKSKTPTLFIHGGNDPFIPVTMSEKLYLACASPKELLVIEKGQHARSYLADGQLYFAKIFAFIDQHR